MTPDCTCLKSKTTGQPQAIPPEGCPVHSQHPEKWDGARELEFYKERERHFASVLNVADGGRYRADWDAKLRKVLQENEENKRELEWMRQLMAYEARVIEAHYEDYKTFPKSRRAIAEKQVERMRRAALGQPIVINTRYVADELESLRKKAKG